MNVALYSRGANRWAMTERGRTGLVRDAATLAIGPSALHWDGDALTIDLAETCAPVRRRVRGRVCVHPQALVGEAFALDAAGRHRWCPIAPRARVEVTLTKPSLAWSGEGYLDTNAGTEPLEAGFARWDWSRAHRRDDTAILYDAARRDGSTFGLALRIDAHGKVTHAGPPPLTPLPRTLWRMARATRADAGTLPGVQRTLEYSPFYARATIATRLFGEEALAVHETLSLDRFAQPWVRCMLPFRMPRAIG